MIVATIKTSRDFNGSYITISIIAIISDMDAPNSLNASVNGPSAALY